MTFKDRQIVGIISNHAPFINNSGAIQYFVEPLMANEELPDKFTGYPSSFNDDIDDDEYASKEERIDKFLEQVEDKLFIFSYQLNVDRGYPKAKEISLVPKPSSFDTNMKYIPVPVFSSANDEASKSFEDDKRWKLYRKYTKKEDFFSFIKEQKSVGSIYKMNIEEQAPLFVVWKDNDGGLEAVGKIDSCFYDEYSGIILKSNGIKTINIMEKVSQIIYYPNINPTVLFMPENVFIWIADKFTTMSDNAGESKIVNDENEIVSERQNVSGNTRDSIKIEYEEKDESVNTILQTYAEAVAEESKEETIAEDNRDVSTIEDKQQISAEKTTSTSLERIIVDDKNDKLIIQCMEYHSQRSNLFYSTNDMINLHTSMKCNNLTILSGLSGTGKTQIVDIYAKALGVGTSRLLYVPVRPSWNDDSDLLGFVDLVHMVYRPSDTGFIDFLVNAQKDEESKNKLHIVCFDEMNLARVEHYFSQFLSILERPSSQRELILYDKQYRGRLYNSADYPDRIEIGDNIRFIGTVNVDESTYHFSDKVLDRSNIIHLDVMNYASEWKKKQFSTLPSVSWSKMDYMKIIRPSEESTSVRMLLWDIHQMLRSASEKMGVGPRIVKAIEMYLANIPKGFENFGRNEGLDYQIVQRVLTKVRGPESQLGFIIDKPSELTFEKIFDRYEELSDFKMSREVVKQKQRELNAYGYCV